MKHAFIGALFGAMLVAAPALAQEKMSDEQFVEKAGQSGLAEVQMGEVAVQQAASDGVKQFGQRMIDDHTKANQDLEKAIEGKQFTMPTEPSAEHKTKMEQLSGLQGEEFDRTYMREMVTEHQNDIQTFEGYAQSGADAELKSFAQATLPILQEHLRMAQDLAGGEKAATPGETAPQGTTR